MHRIRIVLETGTDVANFVNIANTITDNVYLEDGTGFRADAKSLMGVMYGKFEFHELWVISDNPHLSNKFAKFLI